MPADTCGATAIAAGGNRLTCDKAPGHDGDHRGYLEEHDAVLFWPTATRKLEAIETAIGQVLDELAGDPRALLEATQRIRRAMGSRS
jgi:hypothetical protein